MAGRLTWLGPPGAPVRFPPPEAALAWPNGLLAAGGDLSPERLVEAYRRGIFPWYSPGQPILWWAPDPRAAILAGEFHLSRRMRRALRAGRFSGSFDRAFPAVVEGCARRHDPSTGTWITGQMAAAYLRLHELGLAHSVECWADGRLVGGVYGVALGRVFFAESMFSLVTDASKAALAHLWNRMAAQGFEMMDCQMISPHLARLGARNLRRADFLARLGRALEGDGSPAGPWDTGIRGIAPPPGVGPN